MAVCHSDLDKAVQLATPEIPDIQLIDNGGCGDLSGS